MNENITVVVNGRNIEVKNGCVFVFTGSPYDADVVNKVTEDSICEEEDVLESLKHAKTHNDEFFKNLEESISCEDDEEFDNSFDKVVDFLAHLSGEDFLELVSYAKCHNNTFSKYNNNTFFHCIEEIDECINADDAYYSAIIMLAHPLGKAVEDKALELFENAEENAGDFLDLWKALQTINHFC